MIFILSVLALISKLYEYHTLVQAQKSCKLLLLVVMSENLQQKLLNQIFNSQETGLQYFASFRAILHDQHKWNKSSLCRQQTLQNRSRILQCPALWLSYLLLILSRRLVGFLWILPCRIMTAHTAASHNWAVSWPFCQALNRGQKQHSFCPSFGQCS